MASQITDNSNQEESLEESQRVQRLFTRIIPFWPILLLALLLGFLGGYVYLRYQVPVYDINAKLVVNDDSQEKGGNLIELFKLETRNLSLEAEREMAILNSRDLIGKVVSKLQLNVQYRQKGFVKSGQYFKNTPFKLYLQNPDSIKERISGEVQIINNKVSFRSILYVIDTFIESKFGRIKWEVTRPSTPSPDSNRWVISIIPVADATDGIQRALTIKPLSKQSSILQLSFVDAFPERGALILNTLIDIYGSTTIDYKSRISANTLAFLDERLRLVSEELDGTEKDLQSYKSKEKITSLNSEGTIFLAQVKETDARIGELNIQIEVLNKIEEYVNNRNRSNSPIPATLGNTDPVLTNLLDQLFKAEFDLEKLKQITGSKNPEIEVTEASIEKLKPSILASIRNLKMNIEVSLQHFKNVNAGLSNTLGKIPQKERMLLDISRQQSIKNAIYTFLLQKREESAIAAAAIVPNYRIIEKPSFGGLIAPVAEKIYGNAVLLAIILAAIYIYLREFANSRIKFRSQIETSLPEMAVIGEIIFQPKTNTWPVVTGAGRRTLIAEQFRELRTNLNYVTATTTEKCKVILVTSSITEEGKSFITINTAISLTLTGAKVVLLEFDLRRPKVSKQLGIQTDPGLSNYLINMASETEIIKPHTSIPNFSIIPSGPTPPNPAELMGGQKLLDLIAYLKQHFDYVLIDSPPIAAVTDAKILAQVAHATLYIIRHDYTNRSFLKLIRDNYLRQTLPKINLVFNGISYKRILGYTYGKGYGYGYEYGYGYSENEKKGSWWKNILKFNKKSG